MCTAQEYRGPPTNLAHAALVPYLVCLMVRHRSLTLFTAANPGIACGGAVGESKSESLRHLASVPGAIADFLVVDPCAGAAANREAVAAWRMRRRIAFPLIAKPDVGERGWAVVRVHSNEELVAYLAAVRKPVMLQRYLRGIEYGIFYTRGPEDSAGRVISLAEVRYPRAASPGAPPSYRSAERAYRDRADLASAMLHARIEALARAHPGFHFGRFDVIAPSADALRRGRFSVIELNGVLAEAVHMYDPRFGLRDRYRNLKSIWRRAFEIGAANRLRGARPAGRGALARLLLTKFREQSDVMARWRKRLSSAGNRPA